LFVAFVGWIFMILGEEDRRSKQEEEACESCKRIGVLILIRPLRPKEKYSQVCAVLRFCGVQKSILIPLRRKAEKPRKADPFHNTALESSLMLHCLS
jgi:hypothetical protein